MYFSVINLGLVADLILLLLIGMGPQFALVPLLEKTKTFDVRVAAGRGATDGCNGGNNCTRPICPWRATHESPPH
jgi:hypothetical protein